MFKKLNLFSKTEMKLLAFVCGKDGELYERQVADGAGVSAASANAILKRLEKMGLVRKSLKGRMVFYRRNDDNPLLRQFKTLVSVNNLLPVVEKIAPLSTRIVLFGSRAEGRNGEKSDTDLFILSKEKEAVRRAADVPGIQAIVLDAGELAELEKKDKPLFERIGRGIELYGGENG